MIRVKLASIDTEQDASLFISVKNMISLRDWFAGQALTGMGNSYSISDMASRAYDIADTMMVVREQ